MKILVTFAVEQEFAPWRKRNREWRACDGVPDAFEMTHSGARLCALLTGMGCRKPWEDAARGAWGSDFDICISSGLAGALDPGLRCGEVVVADAVRGDAEGTARKCDVQLRGFAAECGAKVVRHFLSSERVLVSKREKAAARAFGEVVEMESRRVLETMQTPGWGARSVAIRAISDEAEEDLPLDFNGMITSSGDVDMAGIMASVARRPDRLPGLMRFAGRSKEAAERLAEFLDNYVKMLASKSKSPVQTAGAR